MLKIGKRVLDKINMLEETQAEKNAVHPDREEWDSCGQDLWTYFQEKDKQKISYFLSKRLSGKNLDLGGGWYLTHPGSSVVDLSGECLKYNPAREKVQFDLEDLAKGARLPFDKHSFDSATMISSWQYIKNSDDLVRELARVLKPGAELYLVNSQGAGIPKCIRGAARSGPIAAYFHRKGFDTLVEDIPCQILEPNDFQSVCVAFPRGGLDGKNMSIIGNKLERLRENHEISANPRKFLEGFANHQVSMEAAKIAQLEKYPVTQQSVDFLKRVSELSREYKQKTGNPIMVFAEHTVEPVLTTMMENELLVGDLLLPRCFNFDRRNSGMIDNLAKKFYVPLSPAKGYFNAHSPEEVVEQCRDLTQGRFYSEEDHDSIFPRNNRYQMLAHLAEFVGALPLNEDTELLQKEIRDALTRGRYVSRGFGEDFDKRIDYEKALAIHLYAGELKQRRNIDKTIARKQEILERGLAVEEKTWDYSKYIPLLKQFYFNGTR